MTELPSRIEEVSFPEFWVDENGSVLPDSESGPRTLVHFLNHAILPYFLLWVVYVLILVALVSSSSSESWIHPHTSDRFSGTHNETHDELACMWSQILGLVCGIPSQKSFC
ncbi:hypothetical protein CDAR_580571 [Caerostris darwini]|uniref:Uncharacterized protein n=1 Tax=Caerostris darwini TaxID=1538125 RepID=A0AAV4R3B2_9ARAC|nr:hypothetical protein CDAR_580571 [Caerostris darwini]